MNQDAERQARRHTLGLMLCAIAHAASTAPSAAQDDASPVRRFEFRVENSRLAKGDKTIRVTQGDNVTLSWTADRTTVVHLHGYDLERTIEPSAPAEMSFAARLTGRFPVETHASRGHHVLLYVEVYPR
jgi:FtsP/CotA-like multicopper oxidase with cupredoxin domain